jgi:polyhydroxybutyrate depolymerase
VRPLLLAALAGLWACAPENSLGGRAYTLQVPRSSDGTTPLPLLLSLHGYGLSGPAQDITFPFSAQVDALNFLYVLPNGTLDESGRRVWRASDTDARAQVDDVSFIRELIAEVRARHPVSRVFLAGYSNGGFLSLRLACEQSQLLDGVISLASSTSADTSRCTGGKKLPVLVVHGTRDTVVPYEGSEGRLGASAIGLAFAWSDVDSVDLLGNSQAETRRQTIAGCSPRVDLWSIEGGGHLLLLDQRFTAPAFQWLLDNAP